MLVLVAVLLALGLGGSVAGAQVPRATRATAEQVVDLATQAVDNDDALAQLRSIVVVDGRPVDLHAATADLGVDRPERLRAIATAFGAAGDRGGETALDRAQARDLATKVLDDGKYQEKKAPRPFRGILRWIADRLRPVGDAFEPLIDAIELVPGGPFLLLGALGGTIGWVAWFLARRSSGAALDRDRSWRLVDPEQDPDQLDQVAATAEAAGDHALAVRARYEAGLIRLARAHRIELRPDTTAGAVAAELHDPTLRELTGTFEAVVYGGRPAVAADSAQARTGWQAVLRTPVAA